MRNLFFRDSLVDPVLRAVLLSWDWRLEVIVILLVLGILYAVGWWRLRKRTSRSRHSRRKSQGHELAARWRLVSYLCGLVIVAIALMSPIDVLGGQLFFMHMIQHLLLIMIAPPLLLIANPMPFILWGLPTNWRRKTGQWIATLLHRKGSFRQGLKAVTGAGIIWLLWTISVIGWHDPSMYNAALRSDLVHDLEHITFFTASMLFWWHVTGAGPRIHKQFGLIGRTAFVLAAIPPNMALGVVLAFAGVVIYSYYEAVPRLWGIDPVLDQRIGGVIMWIPGSMMFIIAALILIAQLLNAEVEKPILTESEWASDEAVAAPGLNKK